jgi:hypothetical protein
VESANHPRISRRRFLGVGGASVGAAALSISAFDVLAAHAGEFPGSQVSGPESAQVGPIYQLQAAFHRAKTTQDIDLMMDLWAKDGSLAVQGDSNSPYVGSARLRAFWLGSGSFTHRRFSLVPSFKTQIHVDGVTAWLYFECHDIGSYDTAERFIAGDTFLAGTVRKHGDRWVFQDMTAGKAAPLSIDHFYFP